MRRGLISSVELDARTFDAAKALIASAELQTVRLSRFKFTSYVDQAPASEESIDLSSLSRFSFEENEDSLKILFDLTLKGYQKDFVVIEIAATIDALYRFPKGSNFTDFQKKSFAKSNGMLNVWPYWREYVQAATQRAGLAPLTLPLFRVVHKKQTPKVVSPSLATKKRRV